jgi:hypothetical protein
MKQKIQITDYQLFCLTQNYEHFAFFGGVGVGKSFTLAQFVIQQVVNYPSLTGFIGANSYDQMSQATLRELFTWLDFYGFQYVIDRQPPQSWNAKRSFKKYSNILSIKQGKDVVFIFTRILSDADALRGLNFSWYAIDETRDTPSNTHDVILSRLRESSSIKGLVVTTTNGEDWVYKRFIKDRLKNYGYMHVTTKHAVDCNILTPEFYNNLLASYSHLKAAQELDAKHVNVNGSRAYYAASERNAVPCSWGGLDKTRSIILACDFNFSPAPCVWVVGQVNEEQTAVHWFSEEVHKETSTQSMAKIIAEKYGEFYITVYGDASGTRGTNSNAGESDYRQIAQVFLDYGVDYRIDVERSNPLVKDRVELVNSLLLNSLDEVRFTYDASKCGFLDSDLKVVGWGTNGKTTGSGDIDRTHASDAVGYACYKLFSRLGQNRATVSRIQSQRVTW